MLETIVSWIRKYREQWSYLIVGGCTTLVNYVVYFSLTYCSVHYMLSNLIAWVAAVAFAYFANGQWVYHSAEKRGIQEAFHFVLSRLFSLCLECALLFLFVDIFTVNENISKLLIAVVVVVVNYFTGRVVYKG